jgi:hypothetical protein
MAGVEHLPARLDAITTETPLTSVAAYAHTAHIVAILTVAQIAVVLV